MSEGVSTFDWIVGGWGRGQHKVTLFWLSLGKSVDRNYICLLPADVGCKYILLIFNFGFYFLLSGRL